MIPRIGPAFVSWRGAFHARKPCGAFSSTCTFFLLFTSTPGRHYTLSPSLPLRALKPADRQRAKLAERSCRKRGLSWPRWRKSRGSLCRELSTKELSGASKNNKRSNKKKYRRGFTWCTSNRPHAPLVRRPETPAPRWHCRAGLFHNGRRVSLSLWHDIPHSISQCWGDHHR